MKMYAWNRETEIVLAVVFENGNVAVSNSKVWKFKTNNEALAVGKRVRKYCGKGYKNHNFPWTTTNVKTGQKTTHFFYETGANF